MPRIREPNYSVRWMASNAPKQLEERLVNALAGDLKGNAQREAPIRTGALRKSITAEKGRVLAKVPYALYVHEGTKAHAIRPRPPRRYLKFRGRDGRWVYSKGVMHPGTKPNRFMRRAMEVTKSRAPAIQATILERWLREQQVK